MAESGKKWKVIKGQSDKEQKLREKYVYGSDNVYKRYAHMAEARLFYTEFRNMAILVDDLDTRFWKRFVLRDYRRKDSIDEEISEDAIRRQYQNCVSDLVALRVEVEEALASVGTNICRALLKEYFVKGYTCEEIAEKWELPEGQVGDLIQQGLFETKVPEDYKERIRRERGADSVVKMNK